MNAPLQGSTAIAPGTVVGGRFEVHETISEDPLGAVLKATDQKTKKAIALRVLKPGVLSPEAFKALRQEARQAARLGHRNIAATYGVGNDPSGAPFVAAEWVGGHPLSEVIRKRREKGGHMSLKAAYNVVAHVCRALTAAAAKTCHGALRPGVVIVTDAGRVKVTEFALSKALLAAKGVEAFELAEQACLAPEVKAGHPPDSRSDIFGVGAILYLLLTGKSPADGFVPPSQAHPDASEAIDQVLLKCLAADPAARYQQPDEVRSALQELVTGAPPTQADDLALDVDVSVEIDLDEGTMELDPAGLASLQKAPAAPAGKHVGQRVSIADPMAAAKPAAAAPLQAAEVDLGQMLQKITENDAARWMVSKDGLDHGPFSGRELVEHIVKGEILDTHELMNMDTGERKPVKQWPEFREFVEQQKMRFEEQRKAAALQQAESSEKRSGVMKFAIAGALLLAVAGGAALFISSLAADDDEEVAEADLGDLFERGEIEIEGTAGILPDPPRRGRGMHRGMGGMGGGRSFGGGFAGSYEDAMNQPIELGDVTMGGGQGRLSPAQVQGVMNRNINRLYNACVPAELRRGGGLSNVTIDIAIAGSGQVMGVSARQGSGAFKSCIRRAVRGVRFPSFGAPRMGARYSFAVD